MSLYIPASLLERTLEKNTVYIKIRMNTYYGPFLALLWHHMKEC